MALSFGLPVVAQAADQPCQTGSLPSFDPAYPQDQLILVCVPPDWNGQLILYAHGYVPASAPLALPAELGLSAVPGQSLPELLVSAGFAFASSSYHKNGYAVEQAGNDLRQLVAFFKSQVPPGSVQKVFLVGASEGGLITAMLVEQSPEIFTGGGLAMCAPLGGMPAETKYLGDFGVIFNTLFPGAAAGGPDAITAAILANAAPGGLTDQLFAVTGAARDPADPSTAVATTLQLMGYNLDAAADLVATVGGQAYDNRSTRYRGSANDRLLNARVPRLAADPAARAYVRRFYQPKGELERPLVSLHTTLDPIVPFSHEAAYSRRVNEESDHGLTQLTVIPVERYGHCNFTPEEMLGAFGALWTQAGGQPSGEMETDLEQLLPAGSER